MPKVLTEIYKPPQTSTLVDFLPHIQLISAGVVLLALVLCLHSRIRRIRPHPIKNINTCRPRTDCFSEALFPGANRRMNTDCPAMVFSPLECEGISCCTDNSPHFLRARPDLWRDMAERLKPHHTIRPPCTDTCTKPLTTCEGDRVQRGCGACVTDVPCAPTQAPCSICGNPTQMDRTTSQPSICNRCRRMPQKQQDTFSTDSSLQRPYGPRNQQSCFVPQNCSLPQNQTESQAQYGMQNVQQNVCKSCGKRSDSCLRKAEQSKTRRQPFFQEARSLNTINERKPRNKNCVRISSSQPSTSSSSELELIESHCAACGVRTAERKNHAKQLLCKHCRKLAAELEAEAEAEGEEKSESSSSSSSSSSESSEESPSSSLRKLCIKCSKQREQSRKSCRSERKICNICAEERMSSRIRRSVPQLQRPKLREQRSAYVMKRSISETPRWSTTHKKYKSYPTKSRSIIGNSPIRRR